MRRFLSFCCLLMLLCSAIPGGASVAAPAGIRFAFVRGGDLWVWEAGAERQLTREGDVQNPRFSPDGRFVAYWREPSVKVIGFDGSGPWAVPKAMTHAWSPTDDTLAVQTPEGVATVAVTSQGPAAVRQVVRGWSGPIVWSPDGKSLAVSRVERQPGNPFVGVASVGILPRAGGEPRVVLRDPFQPGGGRCGAGAIPASWSADGGWLMLVRPGISASISADCNELLLMGATGGTPWKIGETPHPEWAIWDRARPMLAFIDGAGRFVQQHKALKVAMPTSGDVLTLTPPGYADRDPAWAPGGRYLAFTRSREGTPDQAIYQVDLVHPPANRVPGSEGGLAPFFGRDGSLYWFTAPHDGPLTLWHGPEALIRNVGTGFEYYGYRAIPRVFDHWEP